MNGPENDMQIWEIFRDVKSRLFSLLAHVALAAAASVRKPGQPLLLSLLLLLLLLPVKLTGKQAAQLSSKTVAIATVLLPLLLAHPTGHTKRVKPFLFALIESQS